MIRALATSAALVLALAACRPPEGPATVERRGNSTIVNSAEYSAVIPSDWAVEKAALFELSASSGTAGAVDLGFREFPFRAEGRDLHPEKMMAETIAKRFSLPPENVPCAATTPDAAHCALNFLVGGRKMHVHGRSGFVGKRFYVAMTMIEEGPGRDASALAASILAGIKIHAENEGSKRS